MKMAAVSEKNVTNAMDGKNSNIILSTIDPNLVQLKTALKVEIALITIILSNDGIYLKRKTSLSHPKL